MKISNTISVHLSAVEVRFAISEYVREKRKDIFDEHACSTVAVNSDATAVVSQTREIK